MYTCKHTQFTICPKNFNTICWLNHDLIFIKNDNLESHNVTCSLEVKKTCGEIPLILWYIFFYSNSYWIQHIPIYLYIYSNTDYLSKNAFFPPQEENFPLYYIINGQHIKIYKNII